MSHILDDNVYLDNHDDRITRKDVSIIVMESLVLQ